MKTETCIQPRMESGIDTTLTVASDDYEFVRQIKNQTDFFMILQEKEMQL